ncbi:hypothetical protein D3C81_1133670 [compost metagenome]
MLAKYAVIIQGEIQGIGIILIKGCIGTVFPVPQLQSPDHLIRCDMVVSTCCFKLSHIIFLPDGLIIIIVFPVVHRRIGFQSFNTRYFIIQTQKPIEGITVPFAKTCIINQCNGIPLLVGPHIVIPDFPRHHRRFVEQATIEVKHSVIITTIVRPIRS